MLSKEELLQFEADMILLSQYSGLPRHVIKQRLLALKLDLEAQADFVDQQLYCYMAEKLTAHPDQALEERRRALEIARKAQEETDEQQRYTAEELSVFADA